MELAAKGSLKDKLFAAMAQTDCTACGWDCEGYAAALASGETKDITLCVPGEDETESMLKQLMAAAGELCCNEVLICVGAEVPGRRPGGLTPHPTNPPTPHPRQPRG